MFTIYQSNKLDVITSILISLISERKLRETLQPEIILVQNHNITQWLQVELAMSLGIAANIRFSTPTIFIYKLLSSILPEMNLEMFFSRSLISWKIRLILPHFYDQPNCSLIRQYLHNDVDKRKQFHLSEKIADLFYQYFLYRPDWLEIWQQGKRVASLGPDQNWQALLWRALIEENMLSTNLYQLFIQAMKHMTVRPSGLPDRIFIYAVSSLPPIYLQVLQALSNHIDIHFMLVNPYRFNRINKQSYTQQPIYSTNTNQKSINPLLEYWGKQGKDTISLLSELKNIQKIDAFVELSQEKSLLSLLQLDILEDNIVCHLHNAKVKRLLQHNDHSLSINVCHSPQREIEVLHDAILAMIAQEQSLLPCEIIVMVTDINLYIPAIKAVFGNATTDRYLPFTIYDRTVKHTNPVLSVFLRLLKLPFSRLTIEEVLSLLDTSVLAKHFSISQIDLTILRKWIVESGIRWGLDDDTQRDLMLPTTSQHTWEFGLNRMLLGYAIDSSNGIWQGILPYDESSGKRAELIGNLAELIMRLRRWRKNLKKPRKLTEWLHCASDMIKDFFVTNVNKEVETALVIILDQWQQILQCGIKANYDQPVSIARLYDELNMRLQQKHLNQSFISSNIIFCTIMPTSSIPFKVICLLGMNDGIYPHSILPLNFDLMKQQPRRGDYNRYDEDRYIFLELLLSAQQKLYISFIGYFIQDNTLRSPSILISELTNYITQNFYLSGDEQLDEHTCNLHIRKHLWQWHSRMPFAPENFIPGSINQSFAKEWLLAAKASFRSNNTQNRFFMNKSLATKKQENMLLLANLKKFYQHPVRTWFQQRLDLWLYNEPQDISENEPFIVKGISHYKIKEKILNALIEGKNLDVIYQQVRAAGLLAYGAFGKLYWTKQCSKMIYLVDQIRTYILPEQHTEKIQLNIDNTVLIGWLSKIQCNGLVRWYPHNLSMKHGLQLWIEHLAYCAIGGNGQSRMFGTNSQWCFPVLSSDEAKKYLLTLIKGYWQGMSEPLLLLNRSGGAWLTHCFNKKTRMINWEKDCQRTARNYMIKAWEGNHLFPGESSDLYLQKLILQLNENYIIAIIKAVECYFLPPLKFNISNKVDLVN
ncbi:exodeoxyribonuclease V subunit gamma [Candidatus Palibaumannia cicadellinicola]|uniref:RecBCD enzyme subunit RecC n=1 Tax=Baumannia cicadellinicola subsp. Homalodisca coagulata TaxID=374463 RepID=Q1LST9_BAUCH|nr:exodeoxyribonuclease V subunit gamma [Candidatus Baumannia cicadellinicola]ABF14066.1 exodeoxyribonuclease V, gamma subunit [Baumannia cicadellinicola str. Hc (Homalodisca coagulata)]